MATTTKKRKEVKKAGIRKNKSEQKAISQAGLTYRKVQKNPLIEIMDMRAVLK